MNAAVLMVSVALALAFPARTDACEPILPLVRLFGGANLFAVSTRWLGAAVLFKCVVFAVLERRHAAWRSAWFMLLANIFSSVVGLFAAMSAAAPYLFLLVLPGVFCIAGPPARRLSAIQGGRGRKLPPDAIAAAFPVAMFSSFLFWMTAMGVQGDSVGAYWALKLVYVAAGLVMSLGLTTLLEEWIVSLLATRAGLDGRHHLLSVFRANYITLGVVLAVAAARILPTRFASEGFLAALLSAVSRVG